MSCPHPEKHRHASKRATLVARDHLEQAKVEVIDLGLRPYRCDDHWHLGHRSKPITFATWQKRRRRKP